MARALKPQKVDTWRHMRYNLSVDLFLDRNTCAFFCDYAGQQLRKPALAELTRALNELVEATLDLTWQSMITVSRMKPFAEQSDSFVGFKIDRSYICQTSSGSWLQVSWDDYHDEDRLKREPIQFWAREFYIPIEKRQSFKLPCTDDSSGRRHIDDVDCYYLPYTDALWVGLEDIIEKIRILRRSLNQLLTTQEGLAKIESQAAFLLTAGTPGELNG